MTIHDGIQQRRTQKYRGKQTSQSRHSDLLQFWGSERVNKTVLKFIFILRFIHDPLLKADWIFHALALLYVSLWMGAALARREMCALVLRAREPQRESYFGLGLLETGIWEARNRQTRRQKHRQRRKLWRDWTRDSSSPLHFACTASAS